VHIRPARTEELAAVGDLTVQAYVSDGLLAPDDPYTEELRAADERAAEADLLVAVDPDQSLLGTVTYTLAGSPWAEISRPGEAEFRMLAVSPGARGRGVGGALAQWCVDRARETGCIAVALSSLPDMRTAHRIYDRMGFVRAPERDWSPVEGVSLVAYVLDLRP
jgi:GNAT superfamily N-acetyltransferase